MMNLHQRVKLALRGRRGRRRGDPEIARLAALVVPGRRSIDIGANRGVYTYWLARLSQVVEAFEPSPILASRLESTGLSGVTVHRVALSYSTGEARLNVPHHRRGGLDDPGGRLDALPDGVSGDCFATAVCPLDVFAFDKVDFIKIDVEGHEEKVIAGGWAKIIANTPTLLVELEDRHNPGCVGRVAMRFADIGYQMRFFDNDVWHDLRQLAANQIGPSGRYINNFLLVPASRVAEFAGG